MISLKKVMKEEACSALVTAHHMDDQAETILMRLIRGSRPRHLRGIPLKQPFGQGVLIRPLLHFKKKGFSRNFFISRIRATGPWTISVTVSVIVFSHS